MIIMYELIQDKAPGVSLFLIVFLSQISLTQGIFPLERDVNEMTEVSLPKTWLLFTERRIWTCLFGLSERPSFPLVDLLACTAFEIATEMCLAAKYNGFSGQIYCVFMLGEPNIFKVFSFHNLDEIISIHVHQEFHINGTVTLFQHTADIRTEYGLSLVYMELILNGSRYQYRGTRLPWNFINAHHSLSISFNHFRYHDVQLEYSIIHNGSNREYAQLPGKSLSYTIERYCVNHLHIRVDIRARVALNMAPCLLCKFIVYDGPNELLPTILRISKGITKLVQLKASTFQLLVVTISDQKLYATDISYKALYLTKETKNFTNDAYKAIAFGNNTDCGGHSILAQSCVYEITTQSPFNFHLKISNLLFDGIYRGSTFAAGFLVLTDNGKSMDMICEFYDNIFSAEPYELDITFTASRLYVVIYTYSAFSNLSVNIAISPDECIGYFVDKNSWIYAPFYKSPDPYWDTYTLNLTSNVYAKSFCVKVNLLQMGYFKEIDTWYLHPYKFRLETDMPMLLSFKIWKLLYINQPYDGLRLDVHGFEYFKEIHVSQRNYQYRKYIGIFLRLRIHYSKNEYIAITVKSTPCLLFNKRLESGKYPLHSYALNLCKNYYITCEQGDIYIKPNTTLQIQFYPEFTHSLIMSFGLRIIHFHLQLINDGTIRTSGYEFANLSREDSTSCQGGYSMAISPISSISLMYPFHGSGGFVRKTKLKFWMGRWYSLSQSFGDISWKEASRICQSVNAYLLTVNGANEYDFIEREFLSDFDNFVLYAGVKREVMTYSIHIRIVLLHYITFRINEIHTWIRLMQIIHFCVFASFTSWSEIACRNTNEINGMLFVYFQKNHATTSIKQDLGFPALWNRGFALYLRKIGNFIPRAKLQPDWDNECVIIIYVIGYATSWMTIPCDESVALGWICESENTIAPPITAHRYTRGTCCDECVSVSNHCYDIRIGHCTHKLMPQVISDTCMNYISLLLHAMSLHALDKTYTYCGKIFNTTKANVIDSVFVHKRRNQDNTERRISDAELVLTSMNTIPTTCGAGTMRCHDGSCSSLSNICVSDFTCSLDSCVCRMNGILISDPTYCRTKCSFKNCSCSPLMFQCSVEGCVPYFYVCDGQPHCVDASDEFCTKNSGPKHKHLQTKLSTNKHSVVIGSRQCLGFRCTDFTCINHQFVDDLIPDCREAEDEPRGLNMKYKGFAYECRDNQGIPCLPDHSRCFAINKMCLYDHDKFGHVSYCRDASHLFNCVWIECTNSFKCPSSYCIPIRKICDGIKDCIDGEDESGCDKNLCTGHLKCSGTQICIHSYEVCDGSPHCPNSDDEIMCDVKECPVGCQCGGYSAICRDANLLYIPLMLTQNMKYLSIQHRDMFTPDFSNLTFLSELLILDLAWSKISEICLSFKIYFPFYDSLIILYLQHNQLTQLSNGCFQYLKSLKVIQLRGNHLKFISESVFRGLSLESLFLGHIQLTNIADNAFSGLRGLRWLDMSEVQLDHARKGLSKALSQAHAINMRDARLCCIVHDVHCIHGTNSTSLCLRILFPSSMFPFLILLGVCIVNLNIISALVNHNLFARKKPMQHLINSVLLSGGLLCGLYIAVIAATDSYYEERYTVNHFYWRSSFICRGLFVMLSTGLCLSITSGSLLQHIAYKAVVTMVFCVDEIKGLVSKVLLFICLTVAANSIMFAFFQNDFNDMCSVLNLTAQNNLDTILPVFPLAITMLAVLYHNVYTNVCMYTHVYRSTKDIMVTSSYHLSNHNKRMHAMLKTTSQSIAFRTLECSLIPFTIMLKLVNIYISPHICLIALMIPISIASIWDIIIYIWHPFFNSAKQTQKQRANIKQIWNIVSLVKNNFRTVVLCFINMLWLQEFIRIYIYIYMYLKKLVTLEQSIKQMRRFYLSTTNHTVVGCM